MSNFEEIKKQALADLEERQKRAKDWLMSRKVKIISANGGLADHLIKQMESEELPIWRRAFETASEDGKPNDKDIWMLDNNRGFLILIPKGSNTAQCLSLKELLLLPKEDALNNKTGIKSRQQ